MQKRSAVPSMLTLGRLWLSESSLGSKFTNVLNLDTMSLTLVLWRSRAFDLGALPRPILIFSGTVFSFGAVCCYCRSKKSKGWISSM